MVAIPGLSFTSQKTNVSTASDQQIATNPVITVNLGGGVSSLPSNAPLSQTTSQSQTQKDDLNIPTIGGFGEVASGILSAIPSPQVEGFARPVGTGSAFVGADNSGLGLPLPIIILGLGVGAFFFLKGR